MPEYAPADDTRAEPPYPPPGRERIQLGKSEATPGVAGYPTHQFGYPAQPGYHSQPAYPSQQGYPAEPNYPAPPGYPATQYGYPTGEPYSAAAPSSEPTGTSRAGRALAVLGLGVAAAGLFALPVAAYVRAAGDVYYGQVHEFVSEFSGRALDRFYGGLAQIWWHWGLLLAGALLVVLVAIAVATPARRAIGMLIILVAVAAGVLHAVALGTSPDPRAAQVLFRKDSSMYEHPGSGVWVAFAGFAVLALAGLLLTVGPRRR